MINPKEKNEKMPKEFNCKSCNFTTSKESNFNTHELTRKHEILTNPNTEMPTSSKKKYTCQCGKIYKHVSSLCAHKKICTFEESNNISITEIDTPNIENKDKIIETLIKENNDFKNIVLEIVKSNTELQKQVMEGFKNTSNTINSHNNYSNNNNKTFNLQFFLNEQCKDAMNISDFVNTFELQLEDLESVGELGYVEGITKIIVDKLNSMDIYKRPMHCSDAKREILYIKDGDKWEKEERTNPILRKAIKTVSFKNMKIAVLWSDTYPESKDGESRLNDTYMKLIKQSTGGNGEIGDSEDKIIRRIAKEIVINKMQ